MGTKYFITPPDALPDGQVIENSWEDFSTTSL